jgi:alkylhydroperoxidase AhpD family core domain
MNKIIGVVSFFLFSLFTTNIAIADDMALKQDITAQKFNDVRFVQIRLSENKTGYDSIIKKLAGQYGVGNAKNLPIDPEVAELTRLLQSIRGRCAYCVILHEQAARESGISQRKIDSLPAWRESQLFSTAEKAALRYTEVLSDLDQRHIQSAHDELVKNFSTEEIETLLMSIVNMDAYIKIFLAQGRQPVAK